MDVFRVDFNRNPVGIEIVPIFDTHFGSKLVAKTLLNNLIEYIKNNDNVYWFFGGDGAEFISPKDKRFESASIEVKFIKNLHRLFSFSVEYFCEQFEPIKDKLLWMQSGNHDRVMEYDIIGHIAENLEVKNYTNSFEALVKLVFKHNNRTFTYDIYSHHGFGGGRKKGSIINSLDDLAGQFLADCYIAGHSHNLVFSTKPLLKMNSSGTKIIYKDRLLIRVGGFRFSRNDALSYEERLGYAPNAIGTMIICFDAVKKDKTIKTSVKSFF